MIRKGKHKECLWCNATFYATPGSLKKGHGKYCSMSCSGKGLWSNQEHADRMSKAHKGKKPNNALEIYRLSGGKTSGSTGLPSWNKGLVGIHAKEKNPRWISDRSLVKRDEKKHLDSHYKGWSRSVKDRDGWKCKISSPDCKGRLESHHILPWKSYPELRYEINNGITLCAAHHPHKRADEMRLAPVFQELVALTVN